jgi:hypothetical protein
MKTHDMYCGEIVLFRKDEEYMTTLCEGDRRWYLTDYYWSYIADDWRKEVFN